MKSSPRFFLWLGPSLLLFFCACGQSSAPQAATAEGSNPSAASAPAAGPVITDAHRQEAKQLFDTRCTPCHGATGMGDGAASATLSPKPRNFHDAEWQKGVTDDHIEKIIQYGGAAVGKSAAMPSNPDLMSKPEVVAAIREIIRGLGK